jgi:chromosomal replication initiation ATPase DnaA
MVEPRQLTLDLGHRPALAREDFLVAPSNRDAVAWIDHWPNWPGPTLVVHGPAGSGKSHLGAVWRNRAAAVALRPDGDMLQQAGEAPACLVDDAETFRDDAALLHVLNRLAMRRGHALVLARTPPARWQGRLADLMSRLRAAATAAIQPPDDALIAAVLAKQFADRQLRVADGVVNYLVTHMERSLDAARAVVAAADRTALSGNRAVTVPLVREVLAALPPAGARAGLV